MVPGILSAQDKINSVKGIVSYITGQSIYVKFESTLGIETGDTLYIQQENNLNPCLIVMHKSSISCLCNYTSEISLVINDTILAKIPAPVAKEEKINEEILYLEQDINEQLLKKVGGDTLKVKNKQDINGRISLSSYSNLYNNSAEDSHRLRYTLSLNAGHISNSGISAEAYISFRHEVNHWDEIKENLNDALKVYTLSVNYNLNDKLQIWLGRQINRNIANIGAIDGIQAEYNFGKIYAGLAVGSRPDFSDYSFNSNLLEAGAYIGHLAKTETGTTQSSVALFEQRNNGNTDRRFFYIQHSNTLIKNISLYSSVELDLFKLENKQASSNLSLTGLYLSMRYRVSKKLSLFSSYDARKNVIYYETFKNYADLVLQNASRQGLRFRVNYRPFNLINAGADAGTRFQQNDSRKTNTVNGFITFSRLPFINSTLTLNTNLIQTSYLNGEIYGVRLANDFIKGKLYSGLYYRLVNFRYINSGTRLLQNIGEVNLSFQYNKKLYLSVNFEATFEKSSNYNRIYFTVRRKF